MNKAAQAAMRYCTNNEHDWKMDVWITNWLMECMNGCSDGWINKWFNERMNPCFCEATELLKSSYAFSGQFVQWSVSLVNDRPEFKAQVFLVLFGPDFVSVSMYIDCDSCYYDGFCPLMQDNRANVKKYVQSFQGMHIHNVARVFETHELWLQCSMFHIF